MKNGNKIIIIMMVSLLLGGCKHNPITKVNELTNQQEKIDYVSLEKTLKEDQDLMTELSLYNYSYGSRKRELINHLFQTVISSLTGHEDSTVTLNLVYDKDDSYSTTLGYYSSSKNEIMLNMYYLDNDLHELLNTVIHEAFHYYQWDQVKQYSNDHYEVIDVWKYEFGQYANPKNDYQGYYYQSSEESARVYAYYYADMLYYKATYGYWI